MKRLQRKDLVAKRSSSGDVTAYMEEFKDEEGNAKEDNLTDVCGIPKR